jgi:lipoprotein-anchoring transpeptidase ErfK/SrfK
LFLGQVANDVGRIMGISRAGGVRGRAAVVGLVGAVGLVTALVTGCASGSPSASANPGSANTGITAKTEKTENKPEAKPVTLAVAPADKAAAVSPGEPVKVTATDGKLTGVTLVNPEGKQITGQLGADALTWQSAEPLGYNKTYTLTATGVGTNGETSTATSTFTTVRPRTLTYPSMNPLEGQVVGIGQPVAIYFDEPIADKQAAQQAITITTTPKVDGAFYWFSDKEVHWRPQNYWAPGTQVVADIKIYGRDLGNGIYGQEDRRIAFAIGDALVAEADGVTHQMTVRINGAVVRTMPTSMGKPKTPTSNGVHVVTEKNAKKIMDSSSYGVPVNSPDGYRTEVDWAVRISNSGIFTHAAPWSVGDQGHNNVSHGCLNLSVENAKWFFDTAKKGDIVIVTNSGGQTLQAYDGFGDWNVPWSQWLAGGKK